MAKPKKDFSASAKKAPKDKSPAPVTNVLVPTVRDKDGMGHDIFSMVLNKKRLIMVQGQVEGTMAANIILQMKYLEDMDPKEPIKLLINSPGGSVIDGMAIVDIMREVKCPVITIGNGMQASMGSILLAAGDERMMTKNSQLLIHQIMGGAEGGTQHSDFEINAAHMAHLHESLKNVYVESTGLDHKYWDKVGERDTWLSAEQAMKIGFITHIVKNEKPDGPYAKNAKRPEKQRSKVAKIISQAIEAMTREDVIDALNNGNGNLGEWGRYRPELVVRLAEFPEYWVEEKCLENGIDPKTLKPLAQGAAAEAAHPANDDSAKPEKPARKPKAPKAGG